MEAARGIFERIGVPMDPDALVSDLTVAQQQIVEVSRALLAKASILVMDEPTAALTPREVVKLFAILGELKSQGIAIIFVSHRLDEVLQIADRITVMRDGHTIITCDAGSFTKSKLIEQMVGRPLDQEFPKKPQVIGETRFEVRGISGGAVTNVSFIVHRGEVVGITGLMGAGRTELARLLFGADRKESGQVLLDGRAIDIRSPRDAIKNGICLLTEDRKGQGLVLVASAKDNFALPNLRRWSRASVIDRGREMGRFLEHVENLNIRVAGPDQKAQYLSGGNQQKLLVARWLETNSQVVIFDEPTRGIDVGAKHEMYLLINELAAQGKVVIMISSELPEVLGMCDRVLVMRSGRISGEITDMAGASQESIMSLAV
jgi:ABC-type sugar transport system ATPase subunit